MDSRVSDPRQMTPPADDARRPNPVSQAEHLEQLGSQVINFGKFKDQTYYKA